MPITIMRAPILLLALLSFGLLGAWAPEPDPIPTQWQLDFRPGDMRVASFEVAPGDYRAFAFLSYRVANNTGQDLAFVPAFDLATDEGAIIRSGQNVPGSVTAQVLSLLKNEFVQDQISILGTLQQGPENAKDGVVIWPLPDFDIDRLTVYAAGFSGETKPVMLYNPNTGGRERITLRKVRALHFAIPGDVVLGAGRPLEMVGDEWIMR